MSYWYIVLGAHQCTFCVICRIPLSRRLHSSLWRSSTVCLLSLYIVLMCRVDKYWEMQYHWAAFCASQSVLATLEQREIIQVWGIPATLFTALNYKKLTKISHAQVTHKNKVRDWVMSLFSVTIMLLRSLCVAESGIHSQCDARPTVTFPDADCCLLFLRPQRALISHPAKGRRLWWLWWLVTSWHATCLQTVSHLSSNHVDKTIGQTTTIPAGM